MNEFPNLVLLDGSEPLTDEELEELEAVEEDSDGVAD
jgi:hypothetical protein